MGNRPTSNQPIPQTDWIWYNRHSAHHVGYDGSDTCEGCAMRQPAILKKLLARTRLQIAPEIDRSAAGDEVIASQPPVWAIAALALVAVVVLNGAESLPDAL